MRAVVLRRFICLLLLTAIVTAMVAQLCTRWQLLVNVSTSLPQQLYLLHRTKVVPTQGQLIAFAAPGNRLYPQNSLFLKYVAGVPGDTVSFHRDGSGDHWLVAGRIMGLLHRHTRNGLPLLPGPTGVIPPGQYAVWTADEYSYDSRYADIGWISAASIAGIAWPLW